MNVNFYCINNDIMSFIIDFISKFVNKNNEKLLLYSTSMEKIKKFDESLWVDCKDYDFLPHSIFDKNKKINEHEKLLLSTELINDNKCNNLLLSSFVDDVNFLKFFNKVFYIFTKLNNKSVEQARNSLNFFKTLDCNITINEKTKNSWTVIDSF